jgi:8-oxo-dGTP pyrophosphatase MutT (NUDIX family)
VDNPCTQKNTRTTTEMNSSRCYDQTATTPSKISDSPSTNTSQSSISPESSGGGDFVDANRFSNNRFSSIATQGYTTPSLSLSEKSRRPLNMSETATGATSEVESKRTTCFPMNLNLVQALQNHSITRTLIQQKSQQNQKLLVCEENQNNDYTIEDLQRISREARGHLMELTVSREGRELQRWDYLGITSTNKDNNDDNNMRHNKEPNCRLTTGCIPIFPDGRVLLISSTKSSNVFVLPKGGWEQDESLPLSALRETLEEAGVTGLLGPPLPPLTYETKKSVSRRLLLGESTVTPSSKTTTTPEISSRPIVTSYSPISAYHTHNRLIIFPMYVQCIYDDWPEKNRLRRIVTIDEALALLQHRPEFLRMVQALRDRNLHDIRVI